MAVVSFILKSTFRLRDLPQLDTTSIIDVFGDGSCCGVSNFDDGTPDLLGARGITVDPPYSGEATYESGGVTASGKYLLTYHNCNVATGPYYRINEAFKNKSYTILFAMFPIWPEGDSHSYTGYGTHNSDNAYSLRVGYTRSKIYAGNEATGEISVKPRFDGIPQYVAAVYDKYGELSEIYVDGHRTGHYPTGINPSPGGDTFFIDKITCRTGLDQVRFFDRALTQDEVIYLREREGGAPKRSFAIRQTFKEYSFLTFRFTQTNYLFKHTLTFPDKSDVVDVFGDASCLDLVRFDDGTMNSETGFLSIHNAWNRPASYSNDNCRAGKPGKSLKDGWWQMDVGWNSGEDFWQKDYAITYCLKYDTYGSGSFIYRKAAGISASLISGCDSMGFPGFPYGKCDAYKKWAHIGFNISQPNEKLFSGGYADGVRVARGWVGNMWGVYWFGFLPTFTGAVMDNLRFFNRHLAPHEMLHLAYWETGNYKPSFDFVSSVSVSALNVNDRIFRLKHDIRLHDEYFNLRQYSMRGEFEAFPIRQSVERMSRTADFILSQRVVIDYHGIIIKRISQ